jgi:hypothetical protein
VQPKSRLFLAAVPVIIVLLAFLAYEYGYKSVESEMASVKEMEATRLKVLKKHISILSEKPYLQATLVSLKEKRKADNSKIIEAQTPSLSAANLQDTVKGIITSKGGSISSERVEKPEDLGAFRVVNVSMDVVIPDTKVLSDVIYGIETRTPYIVIKELDVRVRNFKSPRELIVKLRVAALTGREKG